MECARNGSFRPVLSLSTMKFLTLSSLITIYTPLLCYASTKIVLYHDCSGTESDYIRRTLKGAEKLMDRTYQLFHSYPDSKLGMMFLGLGGKDLVAYAKTHFQNPAAVIRASGEIPQVTVLQENTIHISCELMKEHTPSTVDAYVSADGRFVYVAPDFFPGGSAEHMGQQLDPFHALEEDYVKYKHALKESPIFVNFPFPTNPIMKMIELLQTILMIMGDHILHRVSPTPATPAGLVDHSDKAQFAQACSALAFIAYAQQALFEESQTKRHGGLGLPKSGLSLESPAIPLPKLPVPQGAEHLHSPSPHPPSHPSSSRSPSPHPPHLSSSSRPPSPHHRRQMQKSRL